MNEPLKTEYAADTIPVFSRWFGSWRISVQRRAFSASDLARHYDRAAPRWGRTLSRFGYPGAYEALLGKAVGDHALEAAGPAPRVLDCGVGTGALSIALARVAAVRFELDAIDISPGMLERAAAGFRSAGIAANLRLGDVRELPFADRLFDIAMTAHVLEHFADPRPAIKEMVRVLKPGGLLVACLTRRSAPGAVIHLLWRTHRLSPAQSRDLLRESGLAHVRCLSLDGPMLCGRMSIACVGAKPRSGGCVSGRAPKCDPDATEDGGPSA